MLKKKDSRQIQIIVSSGSHVIIIIVALRCPEDSGFPAAFGLCM